ncbi:glycerol-3-phosphate responsive antiterminator [Oceanobacillus sp. FSL H7-0719]|uniref:glycerol-3-phosphate responsive antiterminator n=1 Tax=Oceanobacillus sp. FSL H7-0719 TaxID=2954507 RepID=UPI003247CF45
MEIPSGVIPAIRRMKDFEKVLQSNHDTVVFLESRVSQLKSIVKYTRQENKKILLHFDLIQGLKADEYGMEYLIHEVKPDGILSTRGNVIALAKKHKLLAIQRLFLLDSTALDQNIKLVEKFQPDCVEVMPGLIPDMISEIHEVTKLPIIAGGLIKKEEQVNAALRAGATAITTSEKQLWSL